MFMYSGVVQVPVVVNVSTRRSTLLQQLLYIWLDIHVLVGVHCCLTPITWSIEYNVCYQTECGSKNLQFFQTPVKPACGGGEES